MAVDNVQVSSSVGIGGNSFTTAVSNDKLTNEDFLKLMLTELKYQDPTKPMDSQQMLHDQMQMSTIETNMATIEAMQSLSASFAQNALSNAVNMIGKIVENGEIGEDGVVKQYMVSSVESEDGEIFLQGNKIIGYDEETKEFILSQESSYVNFNNVTKIF